MAVMKVRVHSIWGCLVLFSFECLPYAI